MRRGFPIQRPSSHHLAAVFVVHRQQQFLARLLLLILLGAQDVFLNPDDTSHRVVVCYGLDS